MMPVVTPTILLIDDDPLVGQLVEMLVETFKEGTYRVEHEMTYAGGLARLLAGNYVLCLLDYRLRDGDGLELLRQAKARQCATPIIFLTGDTREETDLAAMKGGAADFVTKDDLKPERFERAIAYAIKTAKARADLQKMKNPGA